MSDKGLTNFSSDEGKQTHQRLLSKNKTTNA